MTDADFHDGCENYIWEVLHANYYLRLCLQREGGLGRNFSENNWNHFKFYFLLQYLIKAVDLMLGLWLIRFLMMSAICAFARSCCERSQQNKKVLKQHMLTILTKPSEFLARTVIIMLSGKLVLTTSKKAFKN